jgi:putative hydrolase of the HAD superfamily
VTEPSAILFDAGGVLVFPDPARLRPLISEAGVNPSTGDMIRAHYYAMTATERDDDTGDWWAGYLRAYITSCGVPPDTTGDLAEHMARSIKGFAWTHVNPVARQTLHELATREIPLGIVSNADGDIQEALCDLKVCHVPGASNHDGCVTVGTVIDSTVVGVWKPNPEIFTFALDELKLTASSTILYIGDTLRYDVRGALAAGLTPIHLDPFGDCSAPDGHAHIKNLAELTAR